MTNGVLYCILVSRDVTAQIQRRVAMNEESEERVIFLMDFLEKLRYFFLEDSRLNVEDTIEKVIEEIMKEMMIK